MPSNWVVFFDFLRVTCLTNVLLEHFSSKSGNLCWQEEQKRDDRRVGVSIENEAASMQSRPEVAGVIRQTGDASLPFTAT